MVTTVRRAHASDARGIATVQVKTWQYAYRGIVSQAYLDDMSVDAREERWVSNLADPAAVSFVLEEAGEIRGWVSVGKSRDEDAHPRVAEIWAFYILPWYWGRGYAQLLWEEGHRYLLEGGYEEVTLLVLERNLRGRHFYEKLGFDWENGWVKTFDIGGTPLEEMRYRRRLP